MNNQKLIEFVRNYKFLYDLSDYRYSDTQKKDATWKEISEKLNVSDKECKKSWTLLRDSFRRALKRKKDTKSGQANTIHKKWRYEEQMSFLEPYFQERPTMCTVPVKSCDDDFHIEDSISYIEHLPSSISPVPEEVSNTSTTHEDTPMKRTDRRRNVFSKTSTNTETPSTTLMKYILENKKNTDDIDQFFAGIATTVKTFPPKERAIAKAKVFEVVSKMEIDILSKPSSSFVRHAAFTPISPVSKSSNQATVSKLPSTIVNTDSESTTSSIQSTSSIHVHNQRPKSSHSASSSRALKPNKSINNDPDNDNMILEKIQLAVDNLKNSNNDEFNIFAQFVATEIRRLPNDLQRQQLKRTIQRAIMDFNENIEKQNLAADLDGGTLNQFVVVNEAGSQIVLNSLRIPKSEEPN